MKLLTICQPYAHLIAIGEKPIENRTWATAYRGPIAIHAGKSREWLDHDDLTEWPGMVFGAIVAVAQLADVVKVDDLPAALIGHVHANGPWCWVLTNVRRLAQPIAISGGLGLRRVEFATCRAIEQQIGAVA